MNDPLPKRYFGQLIRSILSNMNKVTVFFATDAIAALETLDVDPAMPAFFRLAMTPVAEIF